MNGLPAFFLFTSFVAFKTFRLASASEDTDYITCGSAIKITHSESDGKDYVLSSNTHRMNGGSGQQLVTSSPHLHKTTSLWLVREGNGQEPCTTGEKIPYGSRIRLSHLTTESNLHSHDVRSPLSNQQEVTGYGSTGQGDTGDDWIVQPFRGSSKYWEKGQYVHFQHAETGVYLGSTTQAQFTSRNCGHNCPVMDHLEVFGRNAKDAFTKWVSNVGVYLHK